MINEKRYESKSPIKFELRYEVPDVKVIFVVLL